MVNNRSNVFGEYIHKATQYTFCCVGFIKKPSDNTTANAICDRFSKCFQEYVYDNKACALEDFETASNNFHRLILPLKNDSLSLAFHSLAKEYVSIYAKATIKNKTPLKQKIVGYYTNAKELAKNRSLQANAYCDLYSFLNWEKCSAQTLQKWKAAS